MEGVGLYYADDIISNNEAEVMALQEALTLALQNIERWGCRQLRVIGDSQLVVKFMWGTNKPNKPFLA